MELFERVGLREGEQVISIGDAVDRGPDTPGVMAFFPNPRGLSRADGRP